MDFQKIFLVIPTFNEKENLSRLIPILFDLPVANLHLLIVDDSSPDGTQALITVFQKKFPKLFLMSRPKKEGLGRAYVAGFQEALRLGADAILQMDADFSHDPQDIPRLLAALREADWVVGSRYISGGNTKNWSRFRLFLSKFANFYARFVTKMPIFDGTAGFKAWRRGTLENIGLKTVRTNGYGFQLETNFRAFKKGFTVKEIPITFCERRSGSSKMSRKIVWEALWLVLKLRFAKDSH